MNERQPYEQLIAEKLQQLPVPDADASWQQMKRLLDDNQSPDGGGGGRKRFRPGGGGGRWWGAGIIAAALITGIWVYMETRPSPAQPGLASANHTTPANTAAGNKDAPANNSPSANTTFNQSSNDNNTDKTSTQIHPATSSTETTAADKANNAAGSREGQPAGSPAVTNGNRNGSANGAATDNNNNRNNNNGSGGTRATENASSAPAGSLPVTADKDGPASDYSKSLPKKKKPADKTASNRPGSRYRRNIPAPGTPGSNTPANNGPVNKDKANTAKASKIPGNAPVRTRTNTQPGNGHNRDLATQPNGKPSHTNPSRIKDTPAAGGRNQSLTGGRTNQAATGTSTRPADEQWLAKQRERRAHLRELVQPIPHGAVNSSLAGGDSANPYKDTSRLLNNKTKALIAKSLQPDNNAAVAKKPKKPFRLAIKPFSLKTDNDPWWAAGLSFNAPLPVAGQSRYNYNINGGRSLLTDYLPSPYIEFHLNSSVYLQTEINLSAPQYVPQLCLYQKTGPVYTGAPPAMMRDKAIYIQKLYYFNWPVSLHYSPVENLYLTTGLQFSSLQSGLAMIDERRFNALGGTPDTMSRQVIKFKDDSIAAQLRPNEWRWQLGAEYYWKRLTVGMRYNKAFTNLVSVGPANGVPDAKIRNSSVLFFVRVNLFEGRKKDNTNTTLKSLVRY